MTAPARLLLLAALLGGCSSVPQLTPWQAQTLASALPQDCTAIVEASPSQVQPVIVPGGLTVVRSEGQQMILVATRGCVMAVNATTGAGEPLPTLGDSIAPTVVDATSDGVAFGSSLSGSVRAIDTDGAITFNISGLRAPAGLRLMPGGSVLVAEFGAGRVLRVGPNDDSRARLVAEGLAGPFGIAVADATRGYVTEAEGGRVTEFRLDRFEKRAVATGLAWPEGIALMADGRLAVVEVGLRRLVAIEPDSGRIEVMADNLPVGIVSAQGVRDPHAVAGVAAAPDGALFVSANTNRTILRVTPRTPASK